MHNNKKHLLLFAAVLFIAGMFFLFDNIYLKPDSFTSDALAENESGHPKMEDKFFADWHSPYPAQLDKGMLDKIWQEVHSAPREKNLTDSADVPWREIGPYGSLVNGHTNVKFSGRVRDIYVDTTGKIFVAAATGGLMSMQDTTIAALSNDVTSLSSGAFDIMPGNPDYILLGTGEPYKRGGTGLWRTQNLGTNWERVSMAGNYPTSFYRIKFSSQNTVHAAAVDGYYRSDNAGATWIRHLQGEITDVAVNPQNPNILYCGYWDNGSGQGGLYKSTDGGNNWARLNNLPTSNVGRVFVSICRDNPDVIYTLMTTDADNSFLGLYRSNNDGANWSSAGPSAGDIMDGISWYLGSLSVCPTNSSVVLMGGLWLWRTTNSGVNWAMIDDNANINIHADQHSVFWSKDGTTAYIGHDGGVTISTDQGATFSTVRNTFPITQYYNFDVGLSNPDIVFGGCQDNGITGTTDGGVTWKYIFPGAGDGSCVAINPSGSTNIYATLGYFGGNWAYRRMRTTNFGQSWDYINNGLPASNEDFPKVRTDGANASNLYANLLTHIYFSSDNGTVWTPVNGTAFPTRVLNFNVKSYNDTDYVYASLNASTGQRLMMMAGSAPAVECSADIPNNLSVRSISMHPTNSSIAYVAINGLSAGNKIFKTTNRGTNWVNISGNIPNVPIAGVVQHDFQDSVLYAGTEMGCYKSTDAGATWVRWNTGMPEANIVTEIKSYRSASNEFYVIASTYGRGFWVRPELTPLPVELSTFTSNVKENDVILNWSTVQELNNKGFEIERNSSGTGWKKIGFVNGNGTTNNPQSYSFIDNELASGSYLYRIKQIDYNGNYKYYDLRNEIMIGVPNKFVLEQNYPNPFNPNTVISYQLSVAGFVSLKVYDISGREVSSLVNDVKEAGYYSVQFDAKNLSSGTYFYKLSTDKFVEVKKMVVVK
ncbi:MAG: T9SS type A sorting domain-containing protein [Ignavibacteria bacterium]|nr:T9SS type A sorting domain-containing protein [Ignavibacteria bacterium]